MGWWRRRRKHAVVNNEFKPENLVNDLASVSFEYKNGTTLTFRSDSLHAWASYYRVLVTIHDTLAKAAQDKTKPPTTLADELKKAGS